MLCAVLCLHSPLRQHHPCQLQPLWQVLLTDGLVRGHQVLCGQRLCVQDAHGLLEHARTPSSLLGILFTKVGLIIQLLIFHVPIHVLALFFTLWPIPTICSCSILCTCAVVHLHQGAHISKNVGRFLHHGATNTRHRPLQRPAPTPARLAAPSTPLSWVLIHDEVAHLILIIIGHPVISCIIALPPRACVLVSLWRSSTLSLLPTSFVLLFLFVLGRG
mmetsp:Transcript_1817/g.4630  ORF Transcript_1817/g.4630 Transcript_1817/m.4630 type:complete len:218 (-) Transcript_1817:646-1299(-)